MNAGDEFENKNQTFFSKWSKFYDNRFNRLLFFEPTYRQIICLLQGQAKSHLKRPNSKFLDVACGTGEIIARLAPEHPTADFFGTDFTPAMIVKAKQKNVASKNVNFQEANVTQLPFEDNLFDVVICSDAFHHFLNPEKALQEINRVMKNDGLFLLVDPAFNNKLTHFLANVLKKWENAQHYYSKKELLRMLTDNGFFVNTNLTYYFNSYFISFKRG